MLLLTRKVDDKIRIGDDIVIMVVKITDEFGRVKLGIEAPDTVPIIRGKGGINGHRKN